MSKLFRSSLLFSLLTAICCAAPHVANAQKPALVRNQDEPGRNYYVENVFFNQSASTCAGGATCAVVFPPVPAGFRLVVTYVSALYRLVPNTTGAYVSLAGDAGLFTRQIDLPAPVYTGSIYTVTSAPVMFFVEPGNTPVVYLNGDQVSQALGFSSHVSLVGYLVAIP
jgi:hypothetical protein